MVFALDGSGPAANGANVLSSAMLLLLLDRAISSMDRLLMDRLSMDRLSVNGANVLSSALLLLRECAKTFPS